MTVKEDEIPSILQAADLSMIEKDKRYLDALDLLGRELEFCVNSPFPTVIPNEGFIIQSRRLGNSENPSAVQYLLVSETGKFLFLTEIGIRNAFPEGAPFAYVDNIVVARIGNMDPTVNNDTETGIYVYSRIHSQNGLKRIGSPEVEKEPDLNSYLTEKAGIVRTVLYPQTSIVLDNFLIDFDFQEKHGFPQIFLDETWISADSAFSRSRLSSHTVLVSDEEAIRLTALGKRGV